MWMTKLDPDASGFIGTSEFTDAMLNFIRCKMRDSMHRPASATRASIFSSSRALVVNAVMAPGPEATDAPGASGVAANEEDDDEEEEEVPEDLKDLDPQEQQRMIKRRAAWMMGIGELDEMPRVGTPRVRRVGGEAGGGRRGVHRLWSQAPC